MAEFIEDFLRVDFHQIDVFYEKPQVFVKGRGVNRVDHRHEGSPVFVKKLDGFFFKLTLAHFVHEAGLVDGFLPAPVALGGHLGDKLLGLSLVHLHHFSTP